MARRSADAWDKGDTNGCALMMVISGSKRWLARRTMLSAASSKGPALLHRSESTFTQSVSLGTRRALLTLADAAARLVTVSTMFAMKPSSRAPGNTETPAMRPL